MDRNSFFFLIILFIFLMVSCAPETGDTGPTGPEGDDGGSIIMAVYQDDMYPSDNYAVTDDSLLNSDFISSNMGGCGYFLVGVYNISRKYRTVMRYDLTSVAPDNVNVKSAYLTLTIDNASGPMGTTTITAYAMTQEWFEGAGDCNGDANGSVTWAYYQSTDAWDTPGGDFETIPVSDSVIVNDGQTGTIIFELDADTISSWISNDAQNYGFILKGTNESSGTNWARFYSSDSVETAKRPKLTIYYTLP